MLGERLLGHGKHPENTGRYLQNEGSKGIADDMTNLIRRNPIPPRWPASASAS